MLPALKMHAADVTATSHEVRSKEAIANMTKEQKAALLEEIKARVDEIKAMDKSTLTKEDRKALRKELREMRREAKAITGVYISVGALIIIILLLIIIL
jgi:VIT1/CCC1 family predicted Fe2+/Mn2+ transporter